MNSSYDLYYIFYVVAKEGSISAASKALFKSQPAITFQIKKLEFQLGVNLFTRTKRGMRLTDEGKLLFSYVKTGIDSIVNGENALTNLKNLEIGMLRIGVSTSICRFVLMPYLELFHSKYPNIEIQINNDTSNNLVKELRNGNLDILILFSSALENQNFDIMPILKVQDIFVANKKYYELVHKEININDLNSFPLIFPNNPSSSRYSLNMYLKNSDIYLKPKLEVLSHHLIVDLVNAGFGIGFATKEFITDELRNNQLYEIKVKPDIPKRIIVLATIHKKEPNYSVKKFVEMIQDNCKKKM